MTIKWRELRQMITYFLIWWRRRGGGIWGVQAGPAGGGPPSSPYPGSWLLNEYKIKTIIPCTQKKIKRWTNKKTMIVLSTQQYDAVSEYSVQQVTQNVCGTRLQKFSCSQTLHFACQLRHKHLFNLLTAACKFCALPLDPRIETRPTPSWVACESVVQLLDALLNCCQTTAPSTWTVYIPYTGGTHMAPALAHHAYYSARTSTEWRTGTELEDL